MIRNYSFEIRDGYLYMKISGKHESGDFVSYLKVISAECDKEKTNKILVDAMEVQEIVLSMMERFLLGEELAKIIKYKIKIAVVWPEKRINRFTETVAFNRGSIMRTFGNIQQAEKWLLGHIIK
ncbi:MAG: STAS/SEC14 domain-containing protein [Bacteroidales bacterium]|nr:STAS/SEC14 domain-containing protein [Bacteroidales bacterium]